MSLPSITGRMRPALVKSGAVLAVCGLVVLSALGSAMTATADDIEPVAPIIEPAPVEPAPVDVVAPAPAALVAPIANDDLFPGGAGTTDLYIPDLYLNDSDPSSTTLEINDPAGQITVSGQWISVPIAVGFQGNRTFTYRTSGVNGTSNWATVTVAVNPAVKQPIAYSDAYLATSGVTLSVPAPGVISNDDAAQGVTVTGVNDPAAQIAMQPDGSFTYTPAAGFVGVKTFSYQLTVAGMPSNWGTVSITVTGSPSPIAVDDFYETDQGVDLDVPASAGVLANDGSSTATVFDEDDSTLETVLYDDGALHYSPPIGFSGVKILHYAITDGGQQSNWATITIVVHAVAPVIPVAANDTYSMPMNTTLTVDHPGVLSNDSGGMVWWDGGFYSGSLVLYSDGSFTYTPDVGFSGTTVIEYTIRDNYVTSDVATITIEVLDDQLPTLHGADDPAVPTTSTAAAGTLAHTGLDSTWLALPAVALFVLGALALGFSVARRRSTTL